MIAFYTLNTNDINITTLQEYYTKYLKLINSSGRNESPPTKIISELLMRTILAKELDMSPWDINIKIGKYGKPYLNDDSRFFNLSHTEGLLVFATDDAPIGIDVEKVINFPEMEEITLSFSIQEQKLILQAPPSDRLSLFYSIWTLRESYLKALGLGFSDECFSELVVDVQKMKERTIQATVRNDPDWNFSTYSIPPYYLCTICAQAKQFPLNFIEISEKQLFE